MERRPPIKFNDLDYKPITSTEVAAGRNRDTFVCLKCSCSWFEQISVQQYSKNHNVILGQAVPGKGIEFIVLRCIKCLKVYEPNIQIGARDSMRKQYDGFIDEMEKSEENENVTTNKVDDAEKI